MAVLSTFCEPSLCCHVPREFMRRAWLDVTPIIPITVCHQRNYVKRYSRSNMFTQPLTLSRLILFGEASLRHALTQYVAHVHHERNHQGKDNVLLLPTVSQDIERAGPIQCRERLGGLLKYYAHEAA